MNMSDFTTFDSMPSRFSKHQTAFGKYATSHPASEFGWSPEQTSILPPNTPITPSLGMTIAPQSLSTSSAELLTPESLETYYPNDVIAAGNSPLFDELDMGDMQSWESLFNDDDVKPAQEPVKIKEEIYTPQPMASAIDMTGASPVFNTDLNNFDLNTNFDFGILDQSWSASSIPAVATASLGTQSTLQSCASPAIKSTISPVASISKPQRGAVSKESNVRPAKVDDLGITIYKRKPRTTPLKPVEIPVDGDDIGAKRAKNTEAARRSRARKLERMAQLEDRIRLLMDENESLRAEVALLRQSQK